MSDLCPVAVGGDDSGEENQPKTIAESNLRALEQTKFSDVVFTFEKYEDQIEAHQLFLRLRSPVFVAMFRGQGTNVGSMREVKINGVTPQRFRAFLEFMYADKFEVNIAGALDLLHLGHKYKVQPLTDKCEELMKTEIKVEDAVQVFETARKYQHADLEKQAGDIMAKSLAEISKNAEFLNASEDTLVYLLERDDLTVDEVDLFKLVVRWGKNKLSDEAEPDELKNILAQVLPRVRLTNMAPHEFTSEVLPLNLLSPQETISVYAYFGSDEANRKIASASLLFSTKPRGTEKTEDLVVFYKGGSADGVADSGNGPLKECIRFSPSYGSSLPKAWDYSSWRKPALTGILIHWPDREVDHTTLTDDTLSFKLTVKWVSGATSDESVVHKFETFLNDCQAEEEIEIAVESPVELINGYNYSIIVEDTATHCDYPRWSHPEVEFSYSQEGTGSGILNQTMCVSLKRLPVKLTAIGRETDVSDFSEINSYDDIHLIQGIRVSLV